MHLSWPVKNREMCGLPFGHKDSCIICFARGALVEESLSIYMASSMHNIAARPFSGPEVSHNYKPGRVKSPADLRISPRTRASINNRDTKYSAINIFWYHTRNAAGHDCPSRVHSSIQDVLCSPDFPLSTESSTAPEPIYFFDRITNIIIIFLFSQNPAYYIKIRALKNCERYFINFKQKLIERKK